MNEQDVSSAAVGKTLARLKEEYSSILRTVGKQYEQGSISACVRDKAFAQADREYSPAIRGACAILRERENHVVGREDLGNLT